MFDNLTQHNETLLHLVCLMM